MFRLYSTDQAQEEEKKSFNEAILRFSTLYSSNFKCSLSNKYDTMVMVTPKTLDSFDGYMGALGEQATESIHNIMNREGTRIKNIVDSNKKMRHLLGTLNVDKKIAEEKKLFTESQKRKKTHTVSHRSPKKSKSS